MKIFIKTLNGTKFEIRVKPEDTVADLKKIVETIQDENIDPAAELKLVFKGQALEDETTLEGSKISENSNIVVLSSKGQDGIPLIELYYMAYISHAVVEPERQLGKITMYVDGGDKKFHLYRENKIDMGKPLIQYMDHIPIADVGPLCFRTRLVLHFNDLFAGSYDGTIEVRPESFRHRDDGLFKQTIDSVNCNGQISALFGYFNNATIATVEVQLLNMSASATVNVYGVVAALNNHFEASSGTSILFLKKPTDVIKVCSTEEGSVGVIPLSKSRVGVPLGSVMYVDISLVCDDKHHTCTTCFDALKHGTDSQEVDGRFLVKVNWNCDEP